MRTRTVALLLALTANVWAQQNSAPNQDLQRGHPPDTMAPASAQPKAPSPKTEPTAPARKPDKAAAYYHYALAHTYQELVAVYGRAEYANKAIEEFRQAIENDPDSQFLRVGLAELYVGVGRIRDAVEEVQEIIQRDPNNLDARKLLGRIYLRSLGDMSSGTQSQSMLKLAIEQFEQIVRIQPGNIEDRLLLGRLYRLNNDHVKAEEEFKTAVRLKPDSEEAVTTLAYLYNEEGNPQRAADVLASVPEASRTAKLYTALGFTYEQQKHYKKAVEAYRKAVQQDRDNLDAMRGLAQNLLNDGQSDAALEQYKQIADADPQDAQALLRMAEILRRKGKYDKALENLNKAETLVQDSLEVPYNRALVYEAQGKFEDAAKIVEGLLRKDEKADGSYSPGEANNRAVFLDRLGVMYKEQGKTQTAVETFRKILLLGQDNAVRAYQQIIDTYRDAKMWPQATEVAREAVEKFPEDRGLKLVLASQEADMGNADRAVSQVKSLLKGAPEDREVYIALAQIQSRLKRYQDAEQSIAQAEKLSAKNEEKDYAIFVAGSIYERQKKYEQAEEAFKKVLADDPNNAVTLNYLGYMLVDRGVRIEEGLNLVRKAVEIDPQNGAYLDSLGWGYFKLGNYELAEENLRKAVERISNDATIHDHLGDLYQKTGRLKLAAAHWERALDEWNKTVTAEVDAGDVAKVQKKLEAARVKLAQQVHK
ncbi:MAG TPA: tetratricopeptide repeat protein [Terriglobales bacterium]|nr:tetratricopeptide repeat protein [Terriglobales bacterium]